MTQNHLDNFDENNMHLYIPEFAVKGTDEEKIWLTFCYAISQAGGPNVSGPGHHWQGRYRGRQTPRDGRWDVVRWP